MPAATPRFLLLGALALAGASGGCARGSAAPRPPPDAAAPIGPAPADAAAATPAGPPPLDAGGEIIELPVPGYLPTFVSVPVGATGSRPVLVAAHGIGDRPDWQCAEWRRLLGDRAWLVCPRGIKSDRWSTPGDTRWAWHGPVFMRREIDAALAALAERFGPLVDSSRMVYAGFSYGAANGVPIVASDAARFPYVVLTEGGGDRWSTELARRFATGGGARVLMLCGQASCDTEARLTVALIRRGGVDARLEYVAGEGHSYGGGIAARVRESWSWVTADDPRWAL